METYIPAQEFVTNPGFGRQRYDALRNLNWETIDEPIVHIIKDITRLPYCFTLQSCYGHFLYTGQTDPSNTHALPVSADISEVEYRIAYIAFCVEHNITGKGFVQDLSSTVAIDPDYVQFGSADWFWERQVNSFVLQVEPDRLKTKDRIVIPYDEALHVQKIRNDFFKQLEQIISRRL